MDERISNRQACVLTVLYIMTNCFSVLYGVSAGRDLWISHIIAAAISCLLWWLISKACDSFPGCDFFTLLRRTLSRPVAWVITLLLTLFSITAIATSVAAFGKFTQLTALSNTPQIILPLLILLLAAYSLRSGIEVLARCASIIIPFIAFVFFYFLFFGAELVRPENLVPLLENGPLPILRASMSIFINQFGNTVLLLPLIGNISPEKSRRSRGILWGMIIGSASMCLIALSTVATLGQAQTAAEFYPIYTALSVHNIGGFIQHMEILTSLASTFFVLFRAALGLNFLALSVKHLFGGTSARTHLIPLSLIIVSITQFLYGNTMVLRKSMESNISVLIAAPLQFILPTVVFSIAWFKFRRVSDKLS